MCPADVSDFFIRLLKRKKEYVNIPVSPESGADLCAGNTASSQLRPVPLGGLVAQEGGCIIRKGGISPEPEKAPLSTITPGDTIP
jgi:hypothetical protein